LENSNICLTKNPLELKQQYLGESRQFFLEPNRIRLITKNLNGENEYYIGYESISTTTRTITQQNGRVLLIAIAFGFFTLIGLILDFITIHSEFTGVAILFGSAALVFFCLHLYQKRRYFIVDLNNKKSILFIANKPSPEQLASFIKSLYEQRRNFYRKKYFIVDSDDEPEEQLGRLKWLLSQEVISEAEFQEMKALIDPLKKKKEIRDLQSNSSVN